jgi:hypothetical protein
MDSKAAMAASKSGSAYPGSRQLVEIMIFHRLIRHTDPAFENSQSNSIEALLGLFCLLIYY